MSQIMVPPSLKLLRDRGQVHRDESTDGCQAQPAGSRDGLDEMWMESESEETDEDDEDIEETGRRGNYGYSTKYVSLIDFFMPK